jgi:hypothetical protein
VRAIFYPGTLSTPDHDPGREGQQHFALIVIATFNHHYLLGIEIDRKRVWHFPKRGQINHHLLFRIDRYQHTTYDFQFLEGFGLSFLGEGLGEGFGLLGLDFFWPGRATDQLAPRLPNLMIQSILSETVDGLEPRRPPLTETR